MSLLDRVCGFRPPGDDMWVRIPREIFMATLYELAAGIATRNQIVAFWDLDTDETSTLDWLINKYNAQPDAAAKAKYLQYLGIIFALAEGEINGYTTEALVQARINAQFL